MNCIVCNLPIELHTGVQVGNCLSMRLAMENSKRVYEEQQKQKQQTKLKLINLSTNQSKDK